MEIEKERAVENLADSYLAGQMSRRVFISRLLALGLTTTTAGAILAACSSAASPSAATAPPASASAAVPPSAVPSASAAASGPATGLKGTIRFLIGPWTDKEIDHHKVIQAAFNKLNPDVTFTYQLFDWAAQAATYNNSLTAGAHDIYYLEDHSFMAFANQFEDLTSRVNDPSFAAEKDKYLFWDRLANYGGKILGLPNNWAVVDMLYTNMDMVRAAGFDETFVESWDTFVACLKKMTTPDVYGLGIGIQLGPTFGEWYEWLRSAGGSYLTPDLKSTNINLPAVVDYTQKFADLYKQNIAPPIGTWDYNTAPDAFVAGRMAIYSSDMAPAPGIQGKHPTFEWKLLPYPPGPVSRSMFTIVGTYAMSAKTPDKDLGWEVLKFWTSADENAYWTDVSGPYPARSDALTSGYGKEAAPQMAQAFETMAKYAVGAEPFAKWDDCETAAEQQIGRVWTGEVTAAEGVANVDAAVKKLVFG